MGPLPKASRSGWKETRRFFHPVLFSWPFVAVALAVLAALQGGALLPIKTSLYELRFKLTPRPPTGDIVLVEIDSKSIAAVGTWPWPRRIHADLVDALTAAGVAQIGFDVDFSATSREREDAAFETALRRAGGTVILAAFGQKLSNEAGETRISFNRPIQRFADNSWSAAVNVFPDRDGIVRRFPYGAVLAGEPTPSMPAMLSGKVGQVGGDFPIDFGIDASKIDRVSAIDVLRHRVDRPRLAGKKVIIGASAIELRDFFRVPVFGFVPGPLIQMVAAETLMQGRSLRESGVWCAIGGVLFIVWVAACATRVRWWSTLAILLGTSLSCEALGIVVQRLYPFLLDTSAWQATFAGLALARTTREIDFRRLLLAISKQETKDTKALLDQVVADNFAGVIVATDDGLITAASRAAGDILSPGSDIELVGRTIDEALPPELAHIIRQTAALYREGAWRPREPGDFEYARSGSITSILEYVVTPSRLGGDDGQDSGVEFRVAVCLTFVDITKRRHAESHVAYLARFDTLTGLPNRNYFAEKLAEAVRPGSSSDDGSTLFYFDVDRFKNVNDTLGRQFGDLLLQQLAERTRSLLLESDFLTRLDSDQFTILRQGRLTVAEAGSFATNLIAALGSAYVLNGHRAIVDISIGIAQSGGDMSDPASLLKDAETAHRRSKEAGGKKWSLFDPAWDLGSRARQRLETDMRDALDRDEFAVLYQPQIDLASNALVGVEALVRWRHPGRGQISPAEFIPVAEDTGFIEALGAWVLRRACHDAANWPKPIKVAVNLSPIQFTRGDLVKTVEEALKASALPVSRLNLEITESLFIKDSAEIAATVGALRSLGATFSLDDFGTGYSSLNYLRKFPVDKIKLDRSFIMGLPLDQGSVAIVRAVLAMARDLGIRTNAEGVESREQMESLRLLGCQEGQGYLFGKPQPADEIVRALQSSSAQAA